MKGTAIWHDLAKEDLTEIYLYIGADSPTDAERLLDAAESTIEFLLENPRAGHQEVFNSPRLHDTRSWA